MQNHADVLGYYRTIPEWSEILGFGEKLIRRAVKAGELPAVRLSPMGWPRVSDEAIREWLARQRLARR